MQNLGAYEVNWEILGMPKIWVLKFEGTFGTVKVNNGFSVTINYKMQELYKETRTVDYIMLQGPSGLDILGKRVTF